MKITQTQLRSFINEEVNKQFKVQHLINENNRIINELKEMGYTDEELEEWSLKGLGNVGKYIGKGLGNVGKTIAGNVQQSAQQAAQNVKQGVQKAGQAVGSAAQQVGQGIKQAGQAVGQKAQQASQVVQQVGQEVNQGINQMKQKLDTEMTKGDIDSITNNIAKSLQNIKVTVQKLNQKQQKIGLPITTFDQMLKIAYEEE